MYTGLGQEFYTIIKVCVTFPEISHSANDQTNLCNISMILITINNEGAEINRNFVFPIHVTS
jgi:hypothetical protein